MNLALKLKIIVGYQSFCIFENKWKLINNHNYIFRKENSTQHVLITVVDKINKALDKGRLMIGVLLDLKKSLNCADQIILLRKLYAHGIRGSMHECLQAI